MGRKTAGGGILGCGVVLALAALGARPAAADEPGGAAATILAPAASVSAPASSEERWQLWGFALEEYRLRDAVAPSATPAPGEVAPQDETDHKLRLMLQGGFSDPHDHFTGNLSLGLWLDADGNFAQPGPSALGSIYDYGHPGDHVWFDVYTLNADYHSRGTLRLARVGRQVSEHGLPITFDGASLLVNGGKPWLEFFAFGGRTVHFFEVNTGAFEDWVGAAGVAVKPWPFFRFELDYRYTQEQVYNQQSDAEDGVKNHSYGLSAWFRAGDWFNARIYARGLDPSVSHAGLRTKFEWADLGLGVNASLDTQVITLGELNERDDPFFAVLGTSLPNLRYLLEAWKTFETSLGGFGLHAGWNGRHRLRGDNAPFNHNFGRVYLMADGRDVFVHGLFFSISAEGHYTYEAAQLLPSWLFAVGGSLGYEGAGLKAELGTFFQRFKYDYYQDVREIADVRTYYAAVSYKVLDWLSVCARYDFEWADRTIHTVTATVTQSF